MFFQPPSLTSTVPYRQPSLFRPQHLEESSHSQVDGGSSPNTSSRTSSRNDLFNMDWKASSPTSPNTRMGDPSYSAAPTGLISPVMKMEDCFSGRPAANSRSLLPPLQIRTTSTPTAPVPNPVPNPIPVSVPSLSLPTPEFDSSSPYMGPSRLNTCRFPSDDQGSPTDQERDNTLDPVDGLGRNHGRNRVSSESTTMSSPTMPITPTSPMSMSIPDHSTSKVSPLIVSPNSGDGQADRTLPRVSESCVSPVSSSTSRKRLRLIHSKQCLLGEGRYAQVYHATLDGTACAVKVFASDDISTREQAARESQVMRKLQGDEDGGRRICKFLGLIEEDEVEHEWPTTLSRSSSLREKSSRRRSRSETIELIDENLLQTYPACSPVPSQALYLTMSYFTHGTMDQLVGHSPHLVSKSLWQKWMIQGLEALDWCQSRNIVHADIKPANFLLDDELDLYLSDFGSAIIIDPADRAPVDGLGLGTVSYSSPEIVDPSPSKSFSYPTDIFSFGVSLYQALTGRPPYKGKRPVEIMYLVRKGAFWQTEERERLARHGMLESPTSTEEAEEAGGIKRSGSLTVPTHSQIPSHSLMLKTPSTDGLPSQGKSNAASTASEHEKAGTSPNEQSLLDYALRRPSHQINMTPYLNRSPTYSSFDRPYTDDSPAMIFLDGQNRVPESWREMIKNMVHPEQKSRPTANQLLVRLQR